MERTAHFILNIQPRWLLTHGYWYFIYTSIHLRLPDKWCWENWTVTCKRMKLDQYLLPYLILVFGMIFWIWHQKQRQPKQKISKWDYIKLKSICTPKDTINKTKRQPTEWEKMFAIHISDKGLTFKIHKYLKTQTHRYREQNGGCQRWGWGVGEMGFKNLYLQNPGPPGGPSGKGIIQAKPQPPWQLECLHFSL